MTQNRISGSRLQKGKTVISRLISQDIIYYLHEVEGFSIEEIANIISMSVINVKSIQKGFQVLSQKNIESLQQKYNKPIIELIANACHQSHLPEKLRENVFFFKHMQKLKKKTK